MAKRTVIWSPAARAELRAIDRPIALHILQSIDRYLDTGLGDVIRLQPSRTEFRLRAATIASYFSGLETHHRSAARRASQPSL